ncbi:ankyrin repeat, PH and SEC7 domain containing protein secG-like [Anneissia japonica]|uniref:ankyrin repeat, PH and SEC7 domain containing protein secG-like n=1 Tax=Anneissia japonica TaxID=1529436 RepID=UPI00142579C9|nr:ankyrin repeat, PH and SEC7 domain containing protein secG-like [Anneissia japonica]
MAECGSTKLCHEEEVKHTLFHMLKNEDIDNFKRVFTSASLIPNTHQRLVNSTDDSGNSFLNLAVEMNQLELCRFLLINGASPDVGDQEWQMYPLHYAASPEVDVSIVELLIEYGANPNVTNKVFETPLHDVCEFYQPEKTKILLAAKADVNALDQCENTALHKATKTIVTEGSHITLKPEDVCECLAIVKLLVEAGADVNAKEKDDTTALHNSALNCCARAITYLLDNGALVNVVDSHGETPLNHLFFNIHFNAKSLKDEAFNNDSIDITETEKALVVLLDKGGNINHVNTFGDSVLHKVCNSTTEIVNMIINYGADISVKDNLGRTPLHTCIMNSLTSSEENHRPTQMLQICKSLIKRGVSVDENDINGSTPLHYAIDLPSYDITQMLIEEGANVNAPNKSGTVPIHFAVAWIDEYKSLLDLLLKSGADIEATDINGSTVAHYAAWYSAGTHPNCVEFLRTFVDLKRKDMQGNTAVSVAEFIGNMQFVELFGCEDDNADDSSSEGESSEMNEEIKKSNESDVVNTSPEEVEADNSDIDIDEIAPDSLTPIKEEEIPQFIEQFKLYHGNTLNHIIENPYFDEIASSREAHYIHDSIDELVRQILMKITDIDSRFEASAVLSGSVSEGTKIFLPNEFDYLCCLHKFDSITTVVETDPNRPACFASLVMNTQNTRSQRSEFAEFFNDSLLQQDRVSRCFYQLIRKVISGKDILSKFPRFLLYGQPKVAKGRIHSLTVQWMGWLIKKLVISIDFVPTIPKRKWWPSQIQKSRLTTDKHVSSIGCLLITKSDKSEKFQFVPAYKMTKFLRVSFSEVETFLIRKQSDQVKKGYKLAKNMIELVPPLRISDDGEYKHLASELISSYMLKTCLLYILDSDTSGEDQEKLNNDVTDGEQIRAWAFAIFKQLEKFLTDKQGTVPSFFVPEYNLISLEDFSTDATYTMNDHSRLQFCRMIMAILDPKK